VDSRRNAIRTTSTLVREQPLASMVLLRQFYEPNVNGDDKLRAYSLQCEKSRLIGHGEVAKCDHFVKIDSKETGRVCGLVEQDLPQALSVARHAESSGPGADVNRSDSWR
jgi:hypothetical protein